MREKVKLISEEGTGSFYTTTKTKGAEKLRLKKYDPRLRRHVWFKEAKIK